jgi:Cof subfamily protein (haloacid dehalogenase superfamily)
VTRLFEPRVPRLALARRPALVASDLDGTLLAPDLTVHPDLPAAISALRASGVTLVVSTGRMVQSAARAAAGLGAGDGLAVCYSGAVVTDLGTGVWHVHVPLAHDDAADVVRHGRGLGRHLNVYVGDELYVEEEDRWARWTASYADVDVRVTDDLLALVEGRRPTKIVIATDPDDAVALLPGLRARWRDRLNVARSQPHFIEVNDREASKSRALEWVRRRLGASGPTVAVGDGQNDLDMLAWADLGVAIAEGDAEVTAAAGLVVPRAALGRLFVGLADLPART